MSPATDESTSDSSGSSARSDSTSPADMVAQPPQQDYRGYPHPQVRHLAGRHQQERYQHQMMAQWHQPEDPATNLQDMSDFREHFPALFDVMSINSTPTNGN